MSWAAEELKTVDLGDKRRNRHHPEGAFISHKLSLETV
jgi:hypothetical protein